MGYSADTLSATILMKSTVYWEKIGLAITNATALARTSLLKVFAVIDAAFAQRRKTLRAALAGWAGSAANAERVLIAAGVDPGARGESLDVTAFARIASARTLI